MTEHRQGQPSVLRRLLPHIARHRAAFIGTLVSNLLGQCGIVAAAVLGAWLVGRVITGGTGMIEVVGAALGVCVLVVTVATWWESLVAHDLAYRVLADLRVRLYDGIARVAPGRLLGRRSGDLATIALSDIETLEWLYAHTIAQSLTATVVLSGGMVGAALLDPWLLAVALPAAAVLLAVPWLLRRLAVRHGAAVRSAAGELTADVVDTVQGLRELTAFGALDRRRAQLARRTRALDGAQRANAIRGGAEAALTDAVRAAAVAGALLVVVAAVRGGRLDAALAPVAVVLVGAVLGPATELALLVKEFGTLRAAADRIHAVIDTRPAVIEPVVPAAPPLSSPLAGGVSFADVRFDYGGPEVLRGVSFTVVPGGTVALVGASGAGKSTCVHLLLRFWHPTAGRITIGGVDLRDLAERDLRRLVTAVPQDVHLFAGSITDNIRLGRPDATDAEVEAAAAAARVRAFTDDLPDGLDTVVGERGAALSGGQRVRVAVARALLADTPVLILDEAVANLDAESERDLAAALEDTHTGRATLVVAHRLSTIRRASHVVVLADGRVAEQGTFDELAANGSHLPALLDRQLIPHPR